MILLCLDWIGRAHTFAARIFLLICVRYIGGFFGRISWSGRFGLMSAVAAGLMINFSLLRAAPLISYSEFTPEQVAALQESNAFAAVNAFHYLSWCLALLLLCNIVLAYRRTRLSYHVLQLAAWGFFFAWIVLLFLAFDIPNALLGLNREDFDNVMRNMLWFDYLWLWIPGFVMSVFFALPTLRSTVKAYYHVPLKAHEFGDKVLDDFLCRGRNPQIYRSSYWAFAYHFIILLLIPLLMRLFVTYDSYEIPKGDGTPAAQVIKTVKPPKKKPKREYVLNPNSPIIFKQPELDDSISKELDEMTQDVYTATAIGPVTNKKNARPGWPNGMENARVRFIRLEYSGGDWNQDMGKDADYNILLKVREYSGGFKIAEDTESKKIIELNRFRKGKSPPFVYITGRGNININQQEVKILRKYLLEDGGMIFADNGGGHFDRSIRAMLRRVLPDLDFVDIANDDIIYQVPFSFPNGAPPLWAHSGKRAQGIKYNGRWIVFYHQGDINDAWKTGGSGVSPEIRERAFQMGVNVICYAFTQYLAHVYGTQFSE